MVANIPDAGENILHTNVNGSFCLVCRIQKMEKVKLHILTLEPETIIDRNDAVAFLVSRSNQGNI